VGSEGLPPPANTRRLLLRDNFVVNSQVTELVPVPLLRTSLLLCAKVVDGLARFSRAVGKAGASAYPDA
jgi:hypothetical protein